MVFNRLSFEEIRLKRLLTLNEVIKALEAMGFPKVSVHMIRSYLSRDLITRAKIGPPSQFHRRAKYEGYFTREQVLALADIRLRIGVGYSLEELRQINAFAGKGWLAIREFPVDIVKLASKAAPYINACLEGRESHDQQSRRNAERLVNVVSEYEKRKKKVNKKSLGQDLDSSLVEKLNKFLEEKFKQEK